MATLPRYLINGVPSHSLDVRDRALQFGDGLFETLRVEEGQPEFWQEHIDRLQQGCSRLGIAMPSLALLESEAAALINHTQRAVLKMTISAGLSERGYRRDPAAETRRILALTPYPDYEPAWIEQGIEARLCHHRLSSQPALCGIKHLNRLDQVLARAEWNDACQEGVMCDQQGRVIEGTMSNIFIFNGQSFATPELRDCGVRGIIRKVVMSQARMSGFAVLEEDIKISTLLEAEAVFFTNSIIGVWQLRAFEGKQWSTPHPVLRQMNQWIGR